ncbi:MAG TPA: diguanylate cyclase [Desulfosarcina sp.]|nr:diguanylate cyclase [Desulfosarcina sp.]
MPEAGRGAGKAVTLAVGLVSAAVVGVLDYLLGPLVSLGAVYLLPVGLVAWQAGTRAGIVLALCSAGIGLTAVFFAGRAGLTLPQMLWQFITLAGVGWAFAVLLARLRKAQSRTQALSLVDFLTGALNSRAFDTILENEHRKSARYARPLTLAYIGLDHFKRVNDRFGHTVGDTLLRKVARTMMKHLRASDSVARLGGDEFVVLLPETGRESAKTVIPKLCERLAEEMTDNRWPVTLSVAVVTFLRVPPAAPVMIKTAEKLMRTVKKGGKNAVRYAAYNG